MTPRASNIFLACSLLLLLATFAMWCRSHCQRDRLIYTRREPHCTWVTANTYILGTPITIAKAVEAFTLSSGDGRIVFTRIGFVIPRGERLLEPGEPEPDYPDDVPYTAARRAGFAIEHPADAAWVEPGYSSGRFGFERTDTAWDMSFGYWAAPAWIVRAREYTIPYWSVALLFGLAPAARLIGILRLRRLTQSGRCPTCGYDLRATPERCPECGTIPAAAKGAAT